MDVRYENFGRPRPVVWICVVDAERCDSGSIYLILTRPAVPLRIRQCLQTTNTEFSLRAFAFPDIEVDPDDGKLADRSLTFHLGLESVD